MPDIVVNTLEHLLQQHGHIPEPQVLWMFIYVLKDLELNHSQAQLHLDIKPQRIARSTGGSHKLTGYGASRLGTPRYIAPERAQRKPADARSDIYSLGVVLYEAATGKPPFDATLNYELLDAHINKRPAPPQSVRPEVSAELQRIILTAMAKDPAARFQNAREFREALERLVAVHRAQPQTESAGAAAPSAATAQQATESKPVRETGQAATLPAARPRPRPTAKNERIPTGAMTTPGVMSGKRPPVAGQPAPEPKPEPVQAARSDRPQAKTRPADAQAVPQKPASAARTAPAVRPRNTAGRPRRTGLWLAVSGAAVAAAVVALLVGRASAGPKVPALTGLSLDAARAAVARGGLALAVLESRDDTLPEGAVVQQSLAAGVRARKADTVRVVLSTGVVAVPVVAGLTYDEAVERLVRSGFALGAVDSVLDDNQPAGRVVRTSPRADVRAKVRSEVKISVGQGRLTCPDCGTRREPGAKFCITCGYRFSI